MRVDIVDGMSLTEMLLPGSYAGTGDGIESGPFTAHILVAPLPGGSVSLEYVATDQQGDELHREHTVISRGVDDRDRLYIAHGESPFVTTMTQREPSGERFEQPEPVGPYAMAIVISRPTTDSLTYAWHWATTGDDPIEQSCATVEFVG